MNLYLDKKNHPHIKIKIFLSSAPEIVDCYIDTGFSGGISLPDSFHPKFKQESFTIQDFELADGSIITSDVYKIKAQYEHVSKNISLIFSSSRDTLIGIEFLLGFKFVLDLKKFKILLE